MRKDTAVIELSIFVRVLCVCVCVCDTILILVYYSTWSASMSTVFIVKRLEQKLKRSSKLGPNKSITRTL